MVRLGPLSTLPPTLSEVEKAEAQQYALSPEQFLELRSKFEKRHADAIEKAQRSKIWKEAEEHYADDRPTADERHHFVTVMRDVEVASLARARLATTYTRGWERSRSWYTFWAVVAVLVMAALPVVGWPVFLTLGWQWFHVIFWPQLILGLVGLIAAGARRSAARSEIIGFSNITGEYAGLAMKAREAWMFVAPTTQRRATVDSRVAEVHQKKQQLDAKYPMDPEALHAVQQRIWVNEETSNRVRLPTALPGEHPAEPPDVEDREQLTWGKASVRRG